MMLKKILSFFSVVSLVTACGFTPVYQKHGGASAEVRQQLRAVDIADIGRSRTGQILKTELTHALEAGTATPKYRLSITLNRKKDEQAIQQNREVTRYALTLTAHYTLTDLSTGKELDKGSSLMTASFDATQSDFATYAQEQDTEHRMVGEMARDIQFHLIRAFGK